jgi:hypothetical protein
MNVDKPANIYVLYASNPNTASASRKGRPRRSFADQISDYITRDKMTKLNESEITELTKEGRTGKV